MKNILVALDFEEEADKLLSRAFDIGKAFNAKVWIIHIAAPSPEFVGYDVGPQYIRDNRASELREEHRLIQKYSKEFNEKGVEADGLLISGSTIEMIIEESKKLNIDLIIAGNHRHGFIYNAFIGSVTSGIIEQSNIPVMLIPLKQ